MPISTMALLVPLAVAGVVAGASGLLLAAMVFLQWLGGRGLPGRAGGTLSLIRAYVEARKRRICPLIEYRGEKP